MASASLVVAAPLIESRPQADSPSTTATSRPASDGPVLGQRVAHRVVICIRHRPDAALRLRLGIRRPRVADGVTACLPGGRRTEPQRPQPEPDRGRHLQHDHGEEGP